MSGPVGVAVIGAGTISDQYLANMRRFPDLDVVMVADLFEERAAAQASAHGVRESGSPERALEHPDVHLVVNLTIPQAHAEVSSAALAAGKHVFSEKPFATSREQGRALLEQADELGLRVGGAPDTILGAGLQTARRMVERGDIGVPLTGLTLFEVPGPVDDHRNLAVLLSRGAGPLWDMGPYYFTALNQVLGSFSTVVAGGRTARPVRTLVAGPNAGRTHQVEVPTHVTVLAEYASGASSTSTLSWDSPHRRVGHVEIVGEEGTLSIPDPNTFDGTLALLRRGEREWEQVPATGAAGGRGSGPLDMARCLATGEPHRASGRLAHHVVDVMTSVGDSIEEHRWVEITSEAPTTAVLPEGWDPFARTL